MNQPGHVAAGEDDRLARRERDFRGYVETLKSRCKQPEYSKRRVHFRAHFSPTESEFVITDEGKGFDLAAVPDPTDKERLSSASGRGLTLMNAFMDDVQHNEKGNVVRMIKRRPSAES